MNIYSSHTMITVYSTWEIEKIDKRIYASITLKGLIYGTGMRLFGDL